MLGSLTKFAPETYLSVYDNLEFAIRILLAAVLGILIGIERSRRLKEAGIRTHCIVAMTAAVFMILSKYAFVDLGQNSIPGVRGADSARIAAQVVSGISFLGAGIIFKHGRNTVKGLTTAAGMWATAAVGMAIGAGLYWIGLTEAVLLLIMQHVLHQFQYGNDIMTEQKVRVVMLARPSLRSEFQSIINRHGCIIDSSMISRKAEDIIIELDVRSRSPINHDDVMEFISRHAEVKEFKVEDM